MNAEQTRGPEAASFAARTKGDVLVGLPGKIDARGGQKFRRHSQSPSNV